MLRSLRGAVEAVCAQDVELSDEVIAFDDDIDAQYFEVEQGIELLLARQTPVASDLRLVLAMLKDNLHLERMGDLCVTIAKLTKLTQGLPPDETLLDGFREMGERAEQMIRVALRSLEQRDRIAAESLLELDELIDRANRRIVNRLLDIGHEVEQREWGLRMILVSRCLERIGDHAVDIGEQTAYLVTGEFREFTDASLLRRGFREADCRDDLASVIVKARGNGLARALALRRFACDREGVLLAFVAQRATPTNLALAAAAPAWVDARILTPERAATVLGHSDAAVGRLDVADSLDGVEDGLWALGTLAASGVRVSQPRGSAPRRPRQAAHGTRAGAGGATASPNADVAPRRACTVLEWPRRREATFRQLGTRGDVVRKRGRLSAPPSRARARPWFQRHGALVQELVEPAGNDLRVVVAGGVPVGAISRVAAKGEWRTNVSLGGTRVRVDPPPGALALAVWAAAAAGTELVGVDLLPDGERRVDRARAERRGRFHLRVPDRPRSVRCRRVGARPGRLRARGVGAAGARRRDRCRRRGVAGLHHIAS